VGLQETEPVEVFYGNEFSEIPVVGYFGSERYIVFAWHPFGSD
jgi:hypothetical protein